MNILAHRGFWRSPAEKNCERAFRRAFESGFGVETDLRDYGGQVVISHDIPGPSAMSLAAFLELYIACGGTGTLALNVKADGLQELIAESLLKYKIENYFLFDMSVPDTLGYLAKGLVVFTRRSEFELGCALDDRASGLWLDALEEGWASPAVIVKAMKSGRRVALVSPELHRRPHELAWKQWRELLREHHRCSFMICTDLPIEAKDFFK
jgi:hypothetical protein